MKKFSEIFPKIFGQLKIQMGRTFLQRYNGKYFRHKTGSSSYFLVGEISSLLGKKDVFHNLSGKRSKKSEEISVFVEYFPLFMGKIFYNLGDLSNVLTFLIYFLIVRK